MTKKVKNTLKFAVIFIIIIAALDIAGGIYFKEQIIHYKKITLNDIYNSKEFRENAEVFDRTTPDKYGFEYSVNRYYNEKSKLNLYGWYLPSENKSDKTIIFVHGRPDNRIKALKYLDIINKYGLNKEYNIFFPDLRNSGESDSGKCYMGLDFAEDLYYTMKFLKEKKGNNKVVIYAFSMGAMGTSLYYNEYYRKGNGGGVELEKIVLDSPLANVAKTLRQQGPGGLLVPITETALVMFDAEINGALKKMRIGNLLKESGLPILILQGKSDQTTRFADFMAETAELKTNNLISYVTYEKAAHVRIYSNPLYKDDYEKKVAEFLKN